MYAFSRTVFIIVKFLKPVLNYHEMHQSGRKRFVSNRTSYLKDFNFQVNFTILLLFRRRRDKRNKGNEIPTTFTKLDKRSNKQNVLYNSNKNSHA